MDDEPYNLYGRSLLQSIPHSKLFFLEKCKRKGLDLYFETSPFLPQDNKYYKNFDIPVFSKNMLIMKKDHFKFINSFNL